MEIKEDLINNYYFAIDEESRILLDESINKIIEAKNHGGKVVVVTGSGPNIHEGVTTLIAELMAKGVIDGVTMSSAVVAHEMGGVLDRVKRIDADQLNGFDKRDYLPLGNVFELTQMSDEQMNGIASEMMLDYDLISKCKKVEGQMIIKAAGNMAYPMGLYCEKLALEILEMAKTYGVSFEKAAGWGADERTMLGIGAKLNIPVLVSVPQLVGGGSVGIAVGDSIPISRRCSGIADLLDSADVIIESAAALTQEIHDGPFETHTGHGFWAMWMGYKTYSLKGKTLLRIDLDENLKRAWDMDKNQGTVQNAIDEGLPKTKLTRIPFRMEMSAFSRLAGSIPVIGDIGLIWPVIAFRVSKALGIKLDFISHPQQTPEGQKMREKIVEEIKPISRKKITDYIGTMK